MIGSHSVKEPHPHKVAKAQVSHRFGTMFNLLLTAHWGKSYTLWAELVDVTEVETLEGRSKEASRLGGRSSTPTAAHAALV